MGRHERGRDHRGARAPLLTPAGSRAGAWVPVAATLFAIGWGANQFVSLLVAYRERSGLSVATVDALVGVYALGLVPPCW